MTSFRRLAAASVAFAGACALVVAPGCFAGVQPTKRCAGRFPAPIVPGGLRGATMAVTIDAPPSRVWPWLVQMGCDRGGWYSWDRLDNGGVRSTERVHPEWQQISLGDHLASTPDGRAWFEVAALERERFLGLRAPLDLLGRPFDTRGPRPRFYSDSIWSFLLEGLQGRTHPARGQRLRGLPSAPAPHDREHHLLGTRTRIHADAPVREPEAAR